MRRGRVTTARPGTGIALLCCLLAAGCLADDGTARPAREKPRVAAAGAGPADGSPAPDAAAQTTAADRAAASRGAQNRNAPDARALPATSGSGRRVVYSISRQRVWTVRGDGTVDRTYLVSGRRSQPGPGTFRVYSRSRHTSSAVSDETMEYMIRFTQGRRTGAPIGFHSIPVHRDGRPAQTVAQLGQPLSAGCIRQREADAAYLWRFAPVGTKVVVVR